MEEYQVSVNTLDEEMRTVLDSMKEANAPKQVEHQESQALEHLGSVEKKLPPNGVRRKSE